MLLLAIDPGTGIGAVIHVLLILSVIWLLPALVGYAIAREKGRGGLEGFLLGFVFSYLGVIIACLLPTVEAPKRGPHDHWGNHG